MVTKIYDTANIELIDGTELYITPLKIKYFRELMEKFDGVSNQDSNGDSMEKLLDCARIAMKQYYPSIKTISDVEDSIDIDTLYTILDIAAGIKLRPQDKKDNIKKEEKSSKSESSWNDFDIVKIESEVIMLGIWKSYDELESSLSLPELTQIFNTKKDLEYEDKKFIAAMQGVDIEQDNKPNEWEALKAKVASRGQTTNPNDILSFQGIKAQQAGFGIGMGLDYEKVG